MKIRALIVDDEALARDRVRKLLAGEPDLEVIGEASNGPEAVSFIKDQRPDLVFLDVQMPEVSGFDVLRALPAETWPAVIFVTAHDQHAVQAFEIHALDYLLKPFTQARLQAAVERARRHLEARDVTDLNRRLAEWLKASAPVTAYLSRVAVRNNQQTLFIRVEDIDYIESAANYAVVVAGAEKHILRETLTNLEAKLSPESFVRISRSILVNLDRVTCIQSGPRREYLLCLADGRQFLMTRGIEEVQQRLQYAGSASGRRGR